MTVDEFKALEEQLVLHEGEKLTPYKDTADEWTIGVGACLKYLTPDEMAMLLEDGITQRMSRALLKRKIINTMKALVRQLPWFASLDTIRQRVLVDMAFNLGITKLLGFDYFLKAVRDGQWADAKQHGLNSRWAKQVKGRANRLMEMMLTGEDYK